MKQSTKKKNDMINNAYFSKFKPLTNFEIEVKLKHDKTFNGVYMSNRLPAKMETGSYVFNLDKYENNGTHWTCAVNEPNSDSVIYFDSFGISPNQDIERFLRTSGKKIIINTTPYQHILSRACGYYCIYFIKMMKKYKGDVYKVLYDNFELDNPLFNELVIKKFFKL